MSLKDFNSASHESLWIAGTHDTNFPYLQKIEVDVAIIGGGIAGLTSAFILKEAGISVAVIESGNIVKDVTGHTTAKITSLHGFKYGRLVRKHGLKTARIYAQSNQAAIEIIDLIVNKYDIPCDFKRSDAYSYTEFDDNVEMVKNETSAAERAGLPASFTGQTPLPFGIKGAVKCENQAQFHPRKYLLELANMINGNGSFIFEKTRVYNINETQSGCSVITNRGRLRTNQVVIATHFPFYDKGFFYARIYPDYSYAMSMRIKGAVPEGMYYSIDGEHHSIRNQPSDNGIVLIAGGGHHPSGQGKDTFKYYEAIENYVNDRFEVESIDYYWSTMDYGSVDILPFIGKMPTRKKIYVATGYGGWGMTNGTLSAMIISDMILKRPNAWSSIYNPSRINPAKSFQKMISFNTNVMSHYFRGFTVKSGEAEVLKKGEARVMKISGKRTAVYKDDSGKVFPVSAVCPHMRCIVNWNTAEKTWDCPCHGSRFSYEGKVIHGPALADLPKQVNK